MQSLIFFGSFQRYSVLVLEKLLENFQVQAVITTPPQPKGRNSELVKSEVHIFAESRQIPVFTPESLNIDPNELLKPKDNPDYLIVAGYGKLIPPAWLDYPRIMAINYHPSLLPEYKGRFPAEWAILKGETETGGTLIKMDVEFDKGEIITQEKIPLSPMDTKESIYKKLFILGGDMLTKSLPLIASGEITPIPQPTGKFFYARGLTREDGFIPWDHLQMATQGKDVPAEERQGIAELIPVHASQLIERELRALSPWPGVWTIQPDGKRLKLLSARVEKTKLIPLLVQEEGGKPKPWTSKD